jgi:hypothetical protein
VTPEVILSYADGRWRALGLGLDVEHAELRGLEALVERGLSDSGASQVAMRFDMSSLPAWMRQHQAHYFNYVLRLSPRAGDAPRV